MRYEDWDVQLFHGNDDQRKPLREFRPQCNTTSETEDSLRVSGVIPIMTCFVPSLPEGEAFQVSVHSWGGLPNFHFPQDGSRGKQMVFHLKVLVDGVVSCIHTITHEETVWPKSFEHVNVDGLNTPLQFPVYSDSVMQPATWDPRDLQGRIRLEISEGFMATTRGGNLNFIKTANHAIFSFQPAPLYKLEDTRVAYPNPFLTANPLPPQGAWPLQAMMIPRASHRKSSVSSNSSAASGRFRRYSGSSTPHSGSSRSTSGYSIMSASAMPLLQKAAGSMPPPPPPIRATRYAGGSGPRRHASIPPEMLIPLKKN
ncbi:Hypothetical predicted protein [Lecanosticta acicola]|uniref:Uncharacterized protein n=1 Tax=Lecanosticta acicola TaxID=111012 RepID=A0AAI8YR72_9PEZI|nr:Hypothetical predicted protein [Lecanosticta acicola]